ncbi:MAG: murein biosynthesis integral membrane protein MurJ [Candidatus Omnitrophota bacterium]|jgi:putative peptidoglycan lipid II flippase
MDKTHLIKSTGVIGIATAISRILGFIRDIVIAGFFGTAVYAQAFVVAFRIPNLLRDLIGEGAVNAAFVPVLTEELTKNGKRDFFKLAQVLLNILLIVLIVLTVIGVLAAPVIVKLIAPGFSEDLEKFEVTVKLTRLLFPFLLLVGLWAYAMGVLNSLGKFAAPAFGPCLLNLSMIFCAMWFGENVFGLAGGVLIGGLLQLLIQMPSLYSSGWRAAVTREYVHPKAKRVGKLLIPRALGACVYQVNVFVSTILASLSGIVGDGAVAALYYANRIWQMPLAIFGIALAQAALPTMSRHVALNDTGKLKETLSFSLKILFFILIPSSIGLMVMSAPITKILFQRGAFTAYSTQITSDALFYYAIGLVACGGIKILVSAFYSMHDTMTPVKIAAASLVLNLIFNLVLMRPLKVGGLALATSISAVFNFLALYVLLRKRLGDFGTGVILSSFLKVTLASLVMACVLMASLSYFPKLNIAMLLIDIIAGIAAFIAACYLFNVKELKDFLAWILRKK